MNMRRKICLLALYSAGSVAGLFLMMVGWNYITCPVYVFEDQKPFSGNTFYNPYQTMADDTWKKCIFHLHAKSWMGLTNGKNTFEEITDAYRQLNYDVVAISDYMTINGNQSDDLIQIPVYEHGYNVKKVHQLALGARKVVWRDYFFKQNLNRKQHIIDVLKKHSLLVAVNHPSMRSSYPPNDFNYLSGYDLFEVQNGTHLSETAWDAALSSGHPAWLIANDDAHSVDNPARLQREVTFVNVAAPGENAFVPAGNAQTPVGELLSPAGHDILNRLAQGVAFGVHFPRKAQATMQEKIKEAGAVSFPVTIRMHEDTLHIVWQKMMQQIDFIGDNGCILKTVANSDTAFYPVRPEDSYVRIKLTSCENLIYYLNPVVRCSDDGVVKRPASRIDPVKTFCKRVVSVIFSGCFLLVLLHFVLKRKKCKNIFRVQ